MFELKDDPQLYEVRHNGGRSYFPVDRDTTERLNRVIGNRPRPRKAPWVAIAALVAALLLLGYAVVRSL